MEDESKSLGEPAARKARLQDVYLPHVRPLNELVDGLRAAKGPQFGIPYFDPLDGGVDAECLFLLEAPGRRAVESGFVSRNNPDETARNFFLLNAIAGLDRKRTVIWNICPWYVGGAGKIRPVNRVDIVEASEPLEQLLRLLRRLRVVVLVGRKAGSARAEVQRLFPAVAVVEIPHPSPLFINRLPGNRDLLLANLRALNDLLAHDVGRS